MTNTYSRRLKLIPPEPASQSETRSRLDPIFESVLAGFLTASHESFEQLARRISDARYGAIENDEILFSVDGKPWRGELRGRNIVCVLGNTPSQDRTIAARTIIDGHAHAIADCTCEGCARIARHLRQKQGEG